MVLGLLHFLLASCIAFFIPGNLFIRKLRMDRISRVALGIVVGFVLWSTAGFILGYLHLRNLLYLYALACVCIYVKTDHGTSLINSPPAKPGLKIWAVIVLGTLIQLASVWANGITTKNGLYFCCGLPDTVTHLALTSELVREFPPNEPGFSGIPLLNYHYLSNLGVADFIRVFGLPPVGTQYQYMTVVFSLLLGLTAIAFAHALRLDRRFTFWLVFLLYFTGDIIFFLPFLSGHGINFTVTTLENASSLWVSPPRFYAIIVLLSGLTLFVHWLKKNGAQTGVLMAIVLGSLIGFKVYVGMFILSGFAVLCPYYIRTKKYSRLAPILLFAAFSAVLYIPVNTNAGGLVFTGFWRFEDFVVQPALGISHLELARRVFLDHGNFPRAYLYDLFFGFLYIFFSAGTLLLGFIQTKDSLRNIPKELTIVLVSGLITTSAAGFFFLQQTGGANSSQFLISIYIVGAIYAAISISRWTAKLPSGFYIVISTIIILLTSTRVVYQTYRGMTRILNRSGVVIDNDALGAYAYIATTEKNSVILTYDDTSIDCLFITIIGNRPTYTCNAGIPGVIEEKILAQRNTVRQTIFFGNNLSAAQKELQANGISYIYLPKDKIRGTNMEKLHLQEVYKSHFTVLYKVL